jgi:predicted kinase
VPTLFLMCGLPGSGKTTLARQLEREHAALRLSPDEWIAILSFDPYDEGKRAAVEAIQWQVAARALELGSNVVLDFGVWSRRERDDFRARAALLGARTEVRFLDVTRDELLARLEHRNAEHPPGAVRVNERQLDEFLDMFEPPALEELV